MANKPYMPLMMGDWIRGTRGMKAEVKGVYIGLLIHQYDQGFLPTDYDELCLIEPELPKVWDKLKEKFPEVEEGKLRNEKLENVRNFWSKQKTNGSKGGRPKKPKQNPDNNPNGKPKHNHHNYLDLDYDIELKTNKGVEVFEALCKAFKVTDMMPQKIERIKRYVAIREQRNEIEYFDKKCGEYFKFKNGSFLHNLENFLGDESLMNGAWNNNFDVKPKLNWEKA